MEALRGCIVLVCGDGGEPRYSLQDDALAHGMPETAASHVSELESFAVAGFLLPASRAGSCGGGIPSMRAESVFRRETVRRAGKGCGRILMLSSGGQW